jgi:hypothetical protein|tara:strand:+ start:136 stop:498 length:363 start_codon:yes stop_codon:yes gene_type:complete
MKNKPKLLISICVALLSLGAILLINSIQDYSNAEAVADYYKPVTTNLDCDPSDFSCIGDSMSYVVDGRMLEKFNENLRFRSQLESKASKNILFGLILILMSTYGLYYLNYKYEKGEKNEI